MAIDAKIIAIHKLILFDSFDKLLLLENVENKKLILILLNHLVWLLMPKLLLYIN